jgi:hypothetical protein
MASRKKPPGYVGQLAEPVTDVARRVQRRVTNGNHTVWVDDLGSVFVGRANQRVDAPVEFLLGTYGIGHPLQRIVDDLDAMIAERSVSAVLVD